MKLIFIDAIGWDYDASSPQRLPLGGSQSALCYLAAALARRGHEVALLTGVKKACEVLGVHCHSINNFPRLLLTETADAVIALNGPAEFAVKARPILARETPLVFWNQHAADQPAVAGLLQQELCDAWDEVICVSDWHRLTTLQSFPLSPQKVHVLRNAVSPSFERLFSTPDELAQTKADRCLLAYTSTPFRGLKELLELFPTIHREFPETELCVYSSMKVYQVAEEKDDFRQLYAQCGVTQGVRYVGSIPQPELAQALRGVAILSYPNTFAETSCIAVMEAMAAGAFVLSTRLGALPETTLGLGELVAHDGNPQRYLAAYTEALRAVLARRRRDPGAFSRERFEQIRQINALCTWEGRAAEWERACKAWKLRKVNACRSA